MLAVTVYCSVILRK